jgi:hypothetical protein
MLTLFILCEYQLKDDNVLVETCHGIVNLTYNNKRQSCVDGTTIKNAFSNILSKSNKPQIEDGCLLGCSTV